MQKVKEKKHTAQWISSIRSNRKMANWIEEKKDEEEKKIDAPYRNKSIISFLCESMGWENTYIDGMCCYFAFYFPVIYVVQLFDFFFLFFRSSLVIKYGTTTTTTTTCVQCTFIDSMRKWLFKQIVLIYFFFT